MMVSSLDRQYASQSTAEMLLRHCKAKFLRLRTPQQIRPECCFAACIINDFIPGVRVRQEHEH